MEFPSKKLFGLKQVSRSLSGYFHTGSLLLLDTGALAAAFPQEEQFGPAYPACLIQFDGINIGGIYGKSPLHADPVGYFTNRKGSRMAISLAFDHIAPEALDTLFSTFNDLIVNSDIITGLELRKLFFSCQLLVYKLNCRVHDYQILRVAKVIEKSVFKIVGRLFFSGLRLPPVFPGSPSLLSVPDRSFQSGSFGRSRKRAYPNRNRSPFRLPR